MSGAAQIKPLVINGWTLFAHPLFLDQLAELDAHLAAVKRAQPVDWMNKNAAKRQAAVLKVAFELIPQDPTHSQFRQGDTLGENNKHWFRAKFLQQYRLFFRYDLKTRTIILAWVNDDETKRAYESKADAYKTFRKMLAAGSPPSSWDTLLEEARSATGSLAQVTRSTSRCGDHSGQERLCHLVFGYAPPHHLGS